MTRNSIQDWIHREAAKLGPGVTFSIGEWSDTPKPGVGADFDTPTRLGRITSWITGEFDFEVHRISDGEMILFRNVTVHSLAELDEPYSEFLRALLPDV